jgi:hypothetical protein
MFSAGDSWTAPLVGPLEDDLLVVPVFVNGKGPYLFAVDTDATVSVITKHVYQDASLQLADEGPTLADETDQQPKRSYADVLGLEMGTLTLERLTGEVVADHVYDSDGRTIDGLIGRDVILESLGFEFDRDSGTISLLTAKTLARAKEAFTTPPIKLRALAAHTGAEAQPVAKSLVTATIDGTPEVVSVDFGATLSQLRDRSWDKAKLVSSVTKGHVIDEVGTPRAIDHAGVAATVTLGAVTASNVGFVPFTDKRWRDAELEGTLGLDFFAGQSVLVDWGKHDLFLKPRVPLTTEIARRIGRWQSSLMPQCEHLGCAVVSLIDPLANTPPEQRPPTHPGIVVSVIRDAKAKDVALEIVIAVKGADPATQLQWLVANLPANTNQAITHLPAEYLGAQLTVVDASPFPRECPAAGGCIDTLRPPG